MALARSSSRTSRLTSARLQGVQNSKPAAHQLTEAELGERADR